MKRNNVAKRFGIAGLCLATAVSAIGGLSLLNQDVAVAEELTSIAPVSLVTASENATVTYEDGVRISSDTKYSGEINYTFTDNAEFKVTFPNETDGTWWYGNFVYRISDATDESNYFDIVYGVHTTPWTSNGVVKNFTDVSVQYNGEYRSSASDSDGLPWCTEKTLNGTITTGFCGSNNRMKLEWNGDILQVMVGRHTDWTWTRVIAAFDGTEDKGFVSGESWGLPLINFENGYKVSFFSEFSKTGVEDKASDIMFTSINSYSSTSSWSQEYNLAANAKVNSETVTIADRDETYQAAVVGDELIIPEANVDASVKVIQPDGSIVEDDVVAGGKYTVSQKGLHTVQYTTAAGSVAAFSFKAKEMIATKDFVYTTANVSQDESGLRISSDEPYDATIKGVFKEDTTLKFRFPETYTDWWDGDFKVRVADVNDEDNYFEVYYRPDDTKYHYTGAYVLYKDQIRSSRYYADNDGIRHTRSTYGSGDYALSAPSFRSFYSLNGNADRNTREGILSFVWVGDVLQVQVNTFGSDATAVRTIAAFDGTSAFVAKGDWGLPKLNFANGYVISVSSSFTNDSTTDKATDVLFTSIQNGATVYDLTASRVEKDDNRVAFDNAFAALGMVEVEAGEVFLGWKNTVTGELYPAYSFFKKQAGENYEAVVIGFDTINGASVRLDTSGKGESGIRFQTLFDAADYAVVESYVQSFGTLIAYTDTLTTVGKEFTIENYQDQSTFAKVVNTKGTFDYTDEQGTYKAYSMALIGIKDYAKSYSARGYLVVEYVDGTTQTIYTDYDATNNSRSIQQVAQNVIAKFADAYNAMSDAQKAIIDAYAAGNAQ